MFILCLPIATFSSAERWSGDACSVIEGRVADDFFHGDHDLEVEGASCHDGILDDLIL